MAVITTAMTGLAQLHALMQRAGKDWHQFEYPVNGKVFDCNFYTASAPYELTLTTQGLNPLFIRLKVSSYKYMVNTILEPEVYATLCAMLRTHGRSGQKLIPASFLSQLNAHILGIEKLAKSRTETEADDNPSGGPSAGEHFWYWRHHKVRGPSEENLAKTRRLINEEAYRYSIEKRASSVWRSAGAKAKPDPSSPRRRRKAA